MSPLLNPAISYPVLLAVQAFHLLHHRLTKRHISFAEVITAFVLLAGTSVFLLPGWAIAFSHWVLVAVQLVGSVWIKRLSPKW